jgi:hypothetical protein
MAKLCTSLIEAFNGTFPFVIEVHHDKEKGGPWEG